MPKLKTEINTPEMGVEVRAAFAYWLDEQGIEPESTDCFYEHGHWWARAHLDDEDTPERTWSVVDVETKDPDQHFDFEEV